MMDWSKVQKVNERIHRIPVKGKHYAEVNTRVMAFWECFPDGSIDTDIVHLEEGMVVVKATVRIDGVIVSTGLAYEREWSSYINKTSFIENCETSAVGRALGFLGIGAQEGIPTKEEMENAIEQQERLETKIKKTEAKAIASRIYDLDEAGKLNTDKIRDAYGIKDFADLNYEQYDDLCRKLARIENAK